MDHDPVADASRQDPADAPQWAERLRAAFDESPTGMALVRPDGRIRRANRALGALLGHAPTDLEATTLQALAHPDDADADLVPLWLLTTGELAAYQAEKRVLHRDGRALWVLLSVSLIRDGQGRPAYFVAHVQDLTERKGLEQRLRHQALHDPVTGLPNRVLFTDRLGRALGGAGRRGQAVAALLLDLDGFKGVNDGLGHDAGDRLLMAVGRRLAACLRSGDVAARYGGDEFALLIERTKAPADAVAVAGRVLAALRAPVAIGPHDVAISACIGIARSDSGQAHASELLREADVALYRAKALGRGSYAVFDPEAEGGQDGAARGGQEIHLRPATAWLRGVPLLDAKQDAGGRGRSVTAPRDR